MVSVVTVDVLSWCCCCWCCYCCLLELFLLLLFQLIFLLLVLLLFGCLHLFLLSKKYCCYCFSQYEFLYIHKHNSVFYNKVIYWILELCISIRPFIIITTISIMHCNIIKPLYWASLLFFLGAELLYKWFCSFSMMVKWENFGLLQSNATKIFDNDGEMLVNDGEMLVNDGEMSVWSYTHFTIIASISPSLTSILVVLALSKPSFANFPIIEKLHRLFFWIWFYIIIVTIPYIWLIISGWYCSIAVLF